MSDDESRPSWAEGTAWDNYQTAIKVARRAGYPNVSCGWELTPNVHGMMRVAQMGATGVSITTTAMDPGLAALAMAQLLTRAFPSALVVEADFRLGGTFFPADA